MKPKSNLMKDMASKMMKKADRFLDKVVETGTPMTGKEAKSWREGKHEEMD